MLIQLGTDAHSVSNLLFGMNETGVLGTPWSYHHTKKAYQGLISNMNSVISLL